MLIIDCQFVCAINASYPIDPCTEIHTMFYLWIDSSCWNICTDISSLRESFNPYSATHIDVTVIWGKHILPVVYRKLHNTYEWMFRSQFSTTKYELVNALLWPRNTNLIICTVSWSWFVFLMISKLILIEYIRSKVGKVACIFLFNNCSRWRKNVLPSLFDK
jgi:hypothetical protein